MIYILIACGPKEAPPIAVPEPQESTAPVEEVIPEPVIEEPPSFPSNVDLQVSLTFADGSTKSGHLIRIERSERFYGTDDGTWLDIDKKIKLELSTNSGGWQQTPWTEISKVSINPGKVDFNCEYSSEWNPWMYACAVKTQSTASTKDGQKWNVDSKFKWRFYIESDNPSEPDVISFWSNTHRVVQQDDKEVSLGDPNPENAELYEILQNRLREEVKTTMVTQIEFQ
ncbi:MAG: hypothetical protein CMK59_13780 [Proteobacteria bacterium]|nr:hypothetical protein [Pseudomonadota bacterium]